MEADPELSFIETIRLIALADPDDIWLCSDPEEQIGKYDICVYCGFDIWDEIRLGPGGQAGELRWPRNGKPARVERSVGDILRYLAWRNLVRIGPLTVTLTCA